MSNPHLRFRLRSGSFYVTEINPETLNNELTTDPAKALILDHRDNEQAKAKFFSVLFGVPFKAEVVVEISNMKAMALDLWNKGWRSKKDGTSLDKQKPLLPERIAKETGLPMGHAATLCSLLRKWGMGLIKIGDYAKL